MGNKPSEIAQETNVNIDVNERRIEDSDQPIGCCIQFQKAATKIKSKFSCCQSQTSIEINTHGNNNNTNIEIGKR